MKNNDLLILYTDGIIEAMDKEGNQYSRNRLLRLINQNKDLQLLQMITKIGGSIQKFVGTNKQHDDQTLLLLKVN